MSLGRLLDILFNGSSASSQRLLKYEETKSPNIKIECGKCRIMLVAPPKGGTFRCNSCGCAQKCPEELDVLLSTSYGSFCRVPGCRCSCYDKKPSKGSVNTSAPPCFGCGHKRSLHKLADRELKLKVAHPISWTKTDTPKNGSTRVPVSATVRSYVQKVMDATWKDAPTRDRSVPLQKFEVVQVLQNINPEKWKRYTIKRSIIKDEMKANKNGFFAKPKTDEFTQRMKKRTDPLRPEVNEFYLFHGTCPSAASKICDENFKLSLSGSNVGTMLGNGLYFAEASSKSDEYAEDPEDDDSIYQGMYATLICRVVMGTTHVDVDRFPNPNRLTASVQRGQFHSVIGDREKVRGTFREFVVFDSDQVYPEFVVIYRRL